MPPNSVSEYSQWLRRSPQQSSSPEAPIAPAGRLTGAGRQLPRSGIRTCLRRPPLRLPGGPPWPRSTRLRRMPHRVAGRPSPQSGIRTCRRRRRLRLPGGPPWLGSTWLRRMRHREASPACRPPARRPVAACQTRKEPVRSWTGSCDFTAEGYLAEDPPPSLTWGPRCPQPAGNTRGLSGVTAFPVR